VLGQYTSPAKIDELFDRLRDAGRGPAEIEWRRISEASKIYFHAMSGDLAIGFVKKDVSRRRPERNIGMWGMSVDAYRTDFKKHGQTDNMQSAQAEVLKKLQLWLNLAALRSR
jgi:hypothetical protein